jgi:hypothetical protein
MAEEQTEVKVYMVEYRCDKCGNGYLKPTGSMLASSPPWYPHECDFCGDISKFHKEKYPLTRYKTV